MKYDAIIEKIENGHGSDRNLDAEIYVTLGLGTLVREYEDGMELLRADEDRVLHVNYLDGRGPYKSVEKEDVSGCVGWDVFTVPPYTSSVDAALALAERFAFEDFISIHTLAVLQYALDKWWRKADPNTPMSETLARYILIGLFKKLSK